MDYVGIVAQGDMRCNKAVINNEILNTLRLERNVASFTKEVNPRLAKRPLKTNGRLANRGLTALV